MFHPRGFVIFFLSVTGRYFFVPLFPFSKPFNRSKPLPLLLLELLVLLLPVLPRFVLPLLLLLLLVPVVLVPVVLVPLLLPPKIPFKKPPMPLPLVPVVLLLLLVLLLLVLLFVPVLPVLVPLLLPVLPPPMMPFSNPPIPLVLVCVEPPVNLKPMQSPSYWFNRLLAVLARRIPLMLAIAEMMVLNFDASNMMSIVLGVFCT